jgi:tetratricopeptide (TPR) repeat protein
MIEGRDRDALRAWGQASPRLLEQLIRDWSAQGQWDKVIEVHEALAELFPEVPRYRHQLALLWLGQGRDEEAIREWKHAIAVSPQEVRYYIGIGDVYLARGDFAQAAEWYVRAGIVDPSSELPDLQMAVSLMQQHDAGLLNQAYRHLQAALQKNPSNPIVHLHMGDYWLRQGRYGEAAAELESFARLDNTASGLHQYHRSMSGVYRVIGLPDCAVREYRRILEIDPNDAWAQAGLADLQKSGVDLDEPSFLSCPYTDLR